MANEKRRDLIDRQDLIKATQNKQFAISNNTHPYKAIEIQGKYFRECVDNAPTVDAVEVVYGRWLYYSTTMQECSNCQRHTARHKFKYCPHCGAVMEDKYNDG